MNHPNIAQIYGLEKSDGAISLVMELVDGPTLADRIAQDAVAVDERSWSPNGQTLAFIGAHLGAQQVYLRDLASGEAKPLDGTQGAQVFAVPA